MQNHQNGKKKPIWLTFWSALLTMALHCHVGVEVIESAVRLFASVESALVHAFDFFVSPTRTLVLLRAGNWNERVNLHRCVSKTFVNKATARSAYLPRPRRSRGGRRTSGRRRARRAVRHAVRVGSIAGPVGRVSRRRVPCVLAHLVALGRVGRVRARVGRARGGNRRIYG